MKTSEFLEGGAASNEYAQNYLPAYQPLVTDGFLGERTGVRGEYADSRKRQLEHQADE